jgi:hypothetical protein
MFFFSVRCTDKMTVYSGHIYVFEDITLFYITNTAWVLAQLCKYKKRCTRLAAASDKVYQLLAQGLWFSPASSTTKTGRHDIAEILLKTTHVPQVTKKLNNIMLYRVHLAISRVRTQNISGDGH